MSRFACPSQSLLTVTSLPELTSETPAECRKVCGLIRFFNKEGERFAAAATCPASSERTPEAPSG